MVLSRNLRVHNIQIIPLNDLQPFREAFIQVYTSTGGKYASAVLLFLVMFAI